MSLLRSVLASLSNLSSNSNSRLRREAYGWVVKASDCEKPRDMGFPLYVLCWCVKQTSTYITCSLPVEQCWVSGGTKLSGDTCLHICTFWFSCARQENFSLLLCHLLSWGQLTCAWTNGTMLTRLQALLQPQLSYAACLFVRYNLPTKTEIAELVYLNVYLCR